MPNKQQQSQHLGQEMVQRQKLTQQQLLVVRLTELPLTSLEERVKNEVIDNMALEECRRDESDDYEGNGVDGGGGEYDVDSGDTNEEDYSRDDVIDLYDTETNRTSDYSVDDLPSYVANNSNRMNVEMPTADNGSFIDDLLVQIGEYEVDDKTRYLIEYLVGSLNSNGFIHKPLREIADDLEIYHNMDVDDHEMAHALHILQQFDPPGIGARDLQESLILQIDRKLSFQHRTDDVADHKVRSLLELERKVLVDYYQAFVNHNYDKIMDGLGISASEMRAVQEGVAHLNPHPGIALNESPVDKVMTIIPDFIIETEENEIQMWLNEGNIPPLRISRSYMEELDKYEKRHKKLSAEQKEAYNFTKKNVDAAKMFIDAIRQRRHTLYVTMKAIIELQREFFFTQDDDQLRPMILQDVANRAKLDISTVSRVCNSKYAIVDGNVYALKHFFERVRSNAEGEDINIRQVKREIQDLVDGEDKGKPLSDEAITQLLNTRGYNVRRRTVAKYRDQMNIPIAKLRKEITK